MSNETSMKVVSKRLLVYIILYYWPVVLIAYCRPYVLMCSYKSTSTELLLLSYWLLCSVHFTMVQVLTYSVTGTVITNGTNVVKM